MSELWNRLFKKSSKEEEIWKKIEEETKSFESTKEYLEHRKRLDDLYEQHRQAACERREEGRRYRKEKFPRKKVVESETDEERFLRIAKNKLKHEEKVNSYPEKLRNAIHAYESLSEEEKKVFSNETLSYFGSELDDMQNKQITHEQTRQLHDILVQTCIDFINENGLKDVDEVHFNADSLQTSAKYDEWTPDTDSFLEVDGVEYDDKIKFHVRRFIDKSF